MKKLFDDSEVIKQAKKCYEEVLKKIEQDKKKKGGKQ